MKTNRVNRVRRARKAVVKIMRRRLLCRASFVLITGTLILCAAPEPALGNLFVVDGGLFNMNGQGKIGEYTNSGATVNASLISGLSFPGQIAVSDGFLYLVNPLAGTVGKYTTSGATIDPVLISGLSSPRDIEVSGANLYVTEFSFFGDGRVGKYTTLGATVDASLITGLMFPEALAISGTNLFVGDGNGTVGEYTISGATVNGSLVDVGTDIKDVEVSGSSLFISHVFGDDGDVVAKYNLDGTPVDSMLIPPLGRLRTALAITGTDLFFVGEDRVSKYTTSGGLVADPLIDGFVSGSGIAVDNSATVPETLSNLWFGLTTVGLLAFARFLRNSRPLVEASR